MEHILVCLDSSPRAAKVLATAKDLARRTGAKLRLFKAVGIPPEMPIDGFPIPNADLTDVFVESAKKELHEQAETVLPEMLEGEDTAVANAWEGICREAKEHACDLIVIGAHSYSLIERVLGTTPAKVVNHAESSVFVVR